MGPRGTKTLIWNNLKVKPPDETPYSLIYKWRLQQEHNMKAKNGGRGMTDEEVKKYALERRIND